MIGGLVLALGTLLAGCAYAPVTADVSDGNAARIRVTGAMPAITARNDGPGDVTFAAATDASIDESVTLGPGESHTMTIPGGGSALIRVSGRGSTASVQLAVDDGEGWLNGVKLRKTGEPRTTTGK